jgi:hypothetical protein
VTTNHPSPSQPKPYSPPSKAEPWVLGGVAYTTKISIRKRCREVASKRAAGQRIVDPNDHQFMLDLLGRHPDAARKIGPGVEAFEVYYPPPYEAHKGTLIVRVGGEKIDFGWGACIDGHDPWVDLVGAARYAVADQILAFKTAAFARGEVRCEITGVVLSFHDCDVDHVVPFSEIFDNWIADLALTGVDWREIPLVDHAGGTAKVFELPVIEKHFADYHRVRAKLQMTTKKANMSKGGRRKQERPLSP